MSWLLGEKWVSWPERLARAGERAILHEGENKRDKLMFHLRESKPYCGRSMNTSGWLG